MVSVIHAVCGYLFLLLVLRALTRRPGAQMTPFEFVIIFLIGGVIILATVGDDRSETNSVCAIISIALMHRLISRWKLFSRTFTALADGVPLVLLSRGEWQTEVMRNASVQQEDVMAAARVKGVRSLDQIKYAILERTGSISIIKNKD